LHLTQRDFPGCEHLESLPQSLPSGPSGMLKALLVSNIAGLLRAMLPGFSNAYAGSISAVRMCKSSLVGDVVSFVRKELGRNTDFIGV
jgi:TctA family transporter